jgi:hypothetical protein
MVKYVPFRSNSRTKSEQPLEPELPAEVFFDISLMRPDEETWHRGRYFGKKKGAAVSPIV